LILIADATTKFLQELAERGYEPALEKVTGTLRFDIRDGGDAGFAGIAVGEEYTTEPADASTLRATWTAGRSSPT
jgi:hypothetical protein